MERETRNLRYRINQGDVIRRRHEATSLSDLCGIPWDHHLLMQSPAGVYVETWYAGPGNGQTAITNVNIQSRVSSPHDCWKRLVFHIWARGKYMTVVVSYPVWSTEKRRSLDDQHDKPTASSTAAHGDRLQKAFARCSSLTLFLTLQFTSKRVIPAVKDNDLIKNDEAHTFCRGVSDCHCPSW